MRFILSLSLALAMAAITAPADAAKSTAKSGAKSANSRACSSFHSDMRHKGGGYIPPGVTCGKKRKVG